MKKLLAILAALVLLLLTNPGLPAHQAAGAEKIYDSMPSTYKSSAGTMRLATEANARQGVSRKNFGLFSLTEYTPIFGNGLVLETRIVGIGILGQVYVWGIL